MAIETKDLVIYKSERLSDADDGGGKYSGQVIVDGQSNNLFPDISELDRTMGRVSLRKIYPAVVTNDTDSLMGATAFISKVPDDPNVSALLFSTKSWTDERNAAKNRIENYLAKGATAVGSLLDTAYMGMKSIQVAMDKAETEASAGETLVLVSDEGKGTEYQQFVRITKVDTRIAIVRIDGKNVEYKLATYTLNDALDRDFNGVSAAQWYSATKPQTTLRNTVVADSGIYYGSSNMAVDATVGTFTVQAESIFSQIIPSAQTETPLLDVNASGERAALVKANDDPIVVSYSVTVGTTQSLYLGIGVMPSSVSFTLLGQAITDQGGLLKNSAGTQVGTIDYQKGLINWTTAAGTGTTTLNISFIPAASPVQTTQSYAVPVTQLNQSSNWTGTLIPIPAPGSLSISYMSQGRFYELKDNGSGQLLGASPSFGAGTINYETGTWLLTTGALPDVNTPILLLWGTPITTFVRSGLTVAPAGLDFTLTEKGIVTLSAAWTVAGVAKAATLGTDGKFTGDATGYFNRAEGSGRIIPNVLPQQGSTTFNFSYSYLLDNKTQSVSTGAPSGGTVNFTIGTGSAITPKSVSIDVPMLDYGIGTQDSTLHLSDAPRAGDTVGDMVDESGTSYGTITYATGAVSITPYYKLVRYEPTYGSA